MRLLPSALACPLLASLVALPASAAAPPTEVPPYLRPLSPGHARRVAELQRRRDQAAARDDCAAAWKAAEEVARLRARHQGPGHPETVLAVWEAKALRHLAERPGEERRAYAALSPLYEKASRLTRTGKYREAVTLYEQILAGYRKHLGEEHPSTAVVLNNLAYNLGRLGRTEQARAAYERALGIYRRTLGELHPYTAACYVNLGARVNDLGLHAEAERLVRRGLALDRRLHGPDHPSVARGYNNLVAVLQAQGRFAEAQPLAERAILICQRAYGDASLATAACYTSAAINLMEQGRPDGAQPLFELALVGMRRALGDDHPAVARLLGNLGSCLREQGRPAEALALHQKALGLARRALGEGHPDTASAWNSVGAGLSDLGKRREALDAFRKGLAIRRSALGERHPETAFNQLNVASVLEELGRHEEALPLMEKAVESLRATVGDDHPWAVRGRLQRALSLYKRGKFGEAEKEAARAAAGHERARLFMHAGGLERASYSRWGSALPVLATVLARNGKPAEAWQRLEQGLGRGLLDDLTARHARPLPAADREREQALHGRLARLDRQLSAAVGHLPPGDKALRATRDARDAAQAEWSAFQAELDRRYGPVAGKVYDLARVQRHLPADAALVAWVGWEMHGHSENWACVLRQCGAPRWVRLAGSGPGGKWQVEDLELPARLREALAGPAGRDWRPLALRLHDQRLGPVVKLLKAEGDLPAVRHLIVLPSVGLGGLPLEVLLAARPDELPGVRVSYAPSGTLFAWLAERPRRRGGQGALLALGDPAFPPPAAPPRLPAVPEHGVLLTVVRPGLSADRAGLCAGDVLLSWGGRKLEGGKDLVEALKALGEVPAAKVQVWRAGKTFSTTVARGSLGIGADGRPAREVIRARRAADAALVGARDQALRPLPGTRREVEAIARLFAEAEVLLGARASEEELARLAESGRLGSFRHLHFGTHGLARVDRPMQSSLALAARVASGDGPGWASAGRLTAADILARWKLGADLVVLSACRTGLGRYERDEGHVGFAQALFLAGARSLVLSQWNVDDESTALLMERFYQNLLGKRPGLKKPMSKAEALAEAKKWLRNLSAKEVKVEVEHLPRGKGEKPVPLRREARPFAHPYYWAAFVLVGDPS
jgi:tetratricopeptide (TPR) repeat protein